MRRGQVHGFSYIIYQTAVRLRGQVYSYVEEVQALTGVLSKGIMNAIGSSGGRENDERAGEA